MFLKVQTNALGKKNRFYVFLAPARSLELCGFFLKMKTKHGVCVVIFRWICTAEEKLTLRCLCQNHLLDKSTPSLDIIL